MQGVRIQTGAFDAQYGNSGSSIISFTLKSGANDIHGSAYYPQIARSPGVPS